MNKSLGPFYSSREKGSQLYTAVLVLLTVYFEATIDVGEAELRGAIVKLK